MKLRLKTRLRRLAFRLAVLPVPTRLGWYFLGAGLLMFSAGTLYLENSFLLLASVPAGLLLLNALAVWLNLRRVSVRRELRPDTHAGEALEVSLVSMNPGVLPRFALELDDENQTDLYRDESASVTLMVPAKSEMATRYTAVFGRRGRHALRDIVLSTAFPFGLMRMTRHLQWQSDVLVYPRPVRLAPQLEEKLLAAARFFGESSIASRGQEEVYGVREYLPGQNVARIHWRTTARTGKPMILELEGRQDASFCIVLDTAPVGDPGTLRARLESLVGLCAGLTWFFTRQGMLFRFAWHGENLQVSPSGRGDPHYFGIMERLATAGFSDARLGDWIGEVGVGGTGEVPVVLTLGTREHAEASMRLGLNAVVVGATDPDFKQHLRYDNIGRRSISTTELAGDLGGAAS